MNKNALSLLQKSQLEQTSLDRAVLMTKGDMRDEAADELAALTARVKELEEALDGWKGVMYSIPLVNIGAGDTARGIKLVEKTAAALRNKANEYIFSEEGES